MLSNHNRLPLGYIYQARNDWLFCFQLKAAFRLACNIYGYLAKLSFCPNAALRVKILSSQYQLYACGKIFTRALILNQNPHFARYPYIFADIVRPELTELASADLEKNNG